MTTQTLTPLDHYLMQRPNRCGGCGAHVESQGHTEFCVVEPSDEWVTFVAALRSAVRDDGTVHQCDMRPLIRGKVEPKHVGTLYRRAKSVGILVDTLQREPSNDVAGRNSDKLDRVYALRGAR